MSRSIVLSFFSAALLIGVASPATANLAARSANEVAATTPIVRIAANDVATQKAFKTRKTKRVKKVGKPKVGQEKQLNPQPEPPLPRLNPQPEPPKPEPTKK